MREVVEIARTMGPEQLFLALVFLACYALAIGEFATARGRLTAIVTAMVAAAGFAAFSHPWEGGVVLIGFASVGMGFFSAAVWALGRATRPVPALADDQPLDRSPDQSPEANLARTRAVPSSRSVNTAPILNSPAAE